MNDKVDNRLKYIELAKTFGMRANGVQIATKVSQRRCESLAIMLSKAHPKSGEEFEKVEALKDFVIKVSDANERTLELLDYIHGFLKEVSEDSQALIDGAVLRNKIELQSETIELLMLEKRATEILSV